MKSRIIYAIMALAISFSAFSAEKSRQEEFIQAMQLVRDAIREVNNVVENSQGSIDSLNLEMKIDSIVNASIDNSRSYTVDADDYTDEEYYNATQAAMIEAEKVENERRFITRITGITIPFLTIIIIVLLCLNYNYKKRVARYHMVEKAIENNYTIPEYLANEQPAAKSPEWKNVFGTSAVASDGTRPTNNQRPVMPKEFYTNPYKWKELKSGLVMAAVGIALVLAFGANFMGAVCSVLIFIGVGKIVANYLEVRDMERAYIAAHNYSNMPPQPKSYDTKNEAKQQTEPSETVKTSTVEETWRFAPEEIREEIKREEVVETKEENNTPEPPALPKE